MREKEKDVLSFLHTEYPNAKCSLDFHDDFECLISIVLSAQSTDSSVNLATPSLFEAYPTPHLLAQADLFEIEAKIKKIGLYRSKAKHVKALAAVLDEEFNGKIPYERDLLTKLPGVGEKTAGVFLLERAMIPSIPVDTHISRIAKRLGYVRKNEKPLQIERILEKRFPENEWIFLHHSFIAFGREKCHAQKPLCEDCPLKKYCVSQKKTLSTTGK